MNTKKKNARGITLIALVITIIVQNQTEMFK